ncbi:DUF3291 domain-containing protein [Tenacibaculum discolor]|uniref:DUF3291 domain-containing protein n=1 Tax=Tenacibaculum discolor TaxID=361581 RepID=UPI000F5B3AE1|nr:DUF3291 domain-containing protein [Tenacibaculum discolor]
MKKYHIAEINVARMKGVNIKDPIMKEFVDNLDRVNDLAENSDGFVWRLKDENNDATSFNPYNDEQVIINVSIWESIETLGDFVYKTFHTDFLKRRKEWFHSYGKVYTAMWWVPEGEYPTIQEAVDKLDYLQKNGASEVAFDFRNKIPMPKE